MKIGICKKSEEVTRMSQGYRNLMFMKFRSCLKDNTTSDPGKRLSSRWRNGSKDQANLVAFTEGLFHGSHRHKNPLIRYAGRYEVWISTTLQNS